MASLNIAIKSNTCCYHQFCSSLLTSRFCVHAYYHAKTATTRASQECGKITENLGNIFDKVPLTNSSPRAHFCSPSKLRQKLPPVTFYKRRTTIIFEISGQSKLQWSRYTAMLYFGGQRIGGKSRGIFSEHQGKEASASSREAGRGFVVSQNRPLALRGHVTNASFNNDLESS